MRYEPIPKLSKETILRIVANPVDESEVSRALQSAALNLLPDDFDEVLAAMLKNASTPSHCRDIATAIATIAQARRVNPTSSELILKGLPDDDLTRPAKQEALEIILTMRRNGRFLWPSGNDN